MAIIWIWNGLLWPLRAFEAELWGAWEGLKLAREKGFKNVEMRSDSAALVQILKDNSERSSVGIRLVGCIRNLMTKRDWKIKITQVFREANKSADFLANIACEISH